MPAIATTADRRQRPGSPVPLVGTAGQPTDEPRSFGAGGGSGPAPTGKPRSAVAEGQNMPWERSKPISSQSVQQAYVSSRLREINSKSNSDALVHGTLEALMAHVPALVTGGPRSRERVFRQMTSRLQDADLTINFRAPGWFTEENSSESYQQMYERGVRGGRMVLNNKDPLNFPRQRVKDDDKATLPKGWKQAPLQAARGLSPDVGRRRMADKLSPGELEMHNKALGEWDPDQEFVASNVQFDPYTKQVFAALNYGR